MLRVAEQWADSDLGRQRSGNEDSFYVRSPLFVVADGMGGAQAGEVASDTAVRAFHAGLPGGDPGQALARLIERANEEIHDHARRDARMAGMGTTVTAAYVAEDDVVVVAHVGDSRCYLLRDGDLVRLTRDHSLVGELIARGKLTEEQAESHPQRSVITRSVGPEPRVEVDVDRFPARDGDLFLVCSDGLTSMVPEAEVKRILGDEPSLEDAGRTLIGAANAAGGRDNITVVLFRLRSVDGGGATAERVAIAPPPPRERRPVREVADPGPPAPPASRATRPPGRRRRRGRALKLALVFGILAAMVLAAGWSASRAVYFVGTDSRDGRTITIFRGLPYELPFGIDLYSRYAGSGVTIDAVAPARRATFTDHKLRSRDDAEDLVIALEQGRLDK